MHDEIEIMRWSVQKETSTPGKARIFVATCTGEGPGWDRSAGCWHPGHWTKLDAHDIHRFLIVDQRVGHGMWQEFISMEREALNGVLVMAPDAPQPDREVLERLVELDEAALWPTLDRVPRPVP